MSALRHYDEALSTYLEARRILDAAAHELSLARAAWLVHQEEPCGDVLLPWVDSPELLASIEEIKGKLPLAPVSGAGRGTDCDEGPADVCSLSEGGMSAPNSSALGGEL